ncbi:Metallo-peptidase family M12B Reprolysin-like-domain-containing protein [Epithele typhae]|uniref:Metallo-peptidase family M12B Reprolysin-like-domain-containing protein n=1 Tax=Epithele typhae TaxID=378194 RepID=UPI002008B31D|nr:Metallo-peptidase family M12B Reprolysin-like-domain-containing protein [Epithele typhae]KAH9938983.1 Metallo-peptidase family M12B Reprolysin-like-domain-containing protein [Epithele typhae]
MSSHHRLCWLLLVFLASFHAVSALSAPARPLKRVGHPSTLSIDILPRRSPTGSYGKRSFPLDSPVLRYSDSFRLTLTAFHETFHLHLRPNDHLIHPAARINYYKTDQDGQQILSSTRPLLRESVKAYWGEVVPAHMSADRLREDTAGVTPRPSGRELGWARITVYDQGDASAGRPPVFEGAFTVDGVTHHVQTKANYLRNKHALDPHIDLVEDHPEIGLVIWRDSDVMNRHEHARVINTAVDSKAVADGETCGHDHMAFNTDPLQNDAIRRRAPPGSPWYNTLGLLPTNNVTKRDDVAGGGTGSDFSGFIGSTAGCPTTQRIVYMGVAADCEYTSKYGDTDNATQAIITNWNTASALYKSTFQVSLGIVELQVHEPTCPSSAPADAPWNVACSESVTLNDRLSIFSQWRGAKGDDGAGLWHLMSGCPTGSEVGIAWLATLCTQSASGQSPSVVSGTAVSTAGRTEWQVVAHEIGHNFGAIHDCADGCSCTNGCETDSTNCCPLTTSTCDANSKFIMSPVAEAGEMNFSPCSIGNICSLMGGTSGSRSNTTCLIDPSSLNSLTSRPLITLKMCGNGIVEDGEDCDPGLGSNSTCCDVSTCKFTSGAVCDPDSSPCCTNTCGFAPSTQTCRPAVDSRCDTAETCTGTSSACPADVFSPNGQSCGSDGLACASGQCTSLDQQCAQVGASMGLKSACPSNNDKSCQVSCEDPNNSNQCVVLQSNLINGSPCGYGGQCQNGNCQAGSFWDTFKAWYVQNLQISIPVTVVVGVIALLILYGIFRCTCFPHLLRHRSPNASPGLRNGCCGGDRPVKAQRLPSYPGPAPMNFDPSTMVRQDATWRPQTGMRGPNAPATVVAAAVPRQSSHSSHSRSTRNDSASGSGVRPGVGVVGVSRSGSGGGGGGGGGGSAPSRSGPPISSRTVVPGASGHRTKGGSGHGSDAPQRPPDPARPGRSGWVDETLYNGQR